MLQPKYSNLIYAYYHRKIEVITSIKHKKYKKDKHKKESQDLKNVYFEKKDP